MLGFPPEEVTVTLDAALQRMNQALTRLEDAVEQRLEADDAVAGHAIEVQALAEDRARLAQELDQSFARYAQVQTANKDASRRLDQAMETIRLVLGPKS